MGQKVPKKLIEVALPLEAINQASVYEKFIRTGHPNVLHQWWSRKPLSASRGVLFASLVDDPGEYLEDLEEIQQERERLLALVERLVQWDNTANEAVMDEARWEIAKTIARNKGLDVPGNKEELLSFLAKDAPPVWDPFAGGGSIPLEGLRLGLRSVGSDLNPVAVLINKSMLEIPGRFFNQGRVSQTKTNLMFENTSKGLQGLAADIRYYGNWIQKEAVKRVGWLYPKIKLPENEVGNKVTIVAWLWARTVKCPNPACGARMPLASKWDLSKKKGRKTWVEPKVDRSVSPPRIYYEIGIGKGTVPKRTVKRTGAVCLACGTPVKLEYIREEGKQGRLGTQMTAIAAKGVKGRIYLPPTNEQIKLAKEGELGWMPTQEIVDGMAGNVPSYGINTFGELFTKRQLVALNTLGDLIREVQELIRRDAVKAGLSNDGISLENGGLGAQAYSDAVVTYLAFAFSKTLNRSNAFVPWGVNVECPVNLFTRHAIAFIWDFAESNVITGPSGSFSSMLENTVRGLENIGINIPTKGEAFISDAAEGGKNLDSPIISTDPPYYDVIPYSDLSDFFYVWLRHLLIEIYPNIFQTMRSPKEKELVADSSRAGSDVAAKEYFEEGIFKVFRHFCQTASRDYPITVYYAYKQKESRKKGGDTSTGWETILFGIINAGFTITGTWPIRTERAMKMASIGANVLASSIVLVCRVRPGDAIAITRREFIAELQRELPQALYKLQQGNIAPVDLAQSAIGPGMSIFSKYSRVLEADGNPMVVREGLQIINQVMDEYLAEQEGDYDSDTRWAISWFEQFGHDQEAFGVAETLSKAKNTSIEGLVQSGILESRAGKVRLLKRKELDGNWSPGKDSRLTAWEITQQLIRALDKGGEQAAAELMLKIGLPADSARDLAYRLFTICERKGWAQDALGYNMLVIAWPRLKELASKISGETQGRLL
jgi:putative DNA methylase